MNLRWLGSAVLSFGLLALTCAAPGQVIERPDRTDLARVYLEYERALRASPLERSEAIELAGRTFDVATVQFFRGDASSALRVLNELNARLLGGDLSLRTALGSLRVSIEPSVLLVDGVREAMVRAVSLHELPTDLDERALDGLRLLVRCSGGRILGDIQLDPKISNGILNAEGMWSERDDVEIGDYEAVLTTGEGIERVVGRVSVVGDSLTSSVEQFRGRLERLTNREDLQPTVRIVDAWIDLLDPSIRGMDTTRFIMRTNHVLEIVGDGLERLEAGSDPMFRRTGDCWGVIAGPSGDVNFRLYVPEVVTARNERAPLMLVLHGAGGDEHMFFEGCGAGLIKELADAHGFIVVSPSTYPILGDPGVFDLIVETIGGWHDIDQERVLVLGHSLGGITASGLAQLRADRIAGVCGIAGSRPFVTTMVCAPTLIIGAGKDVVVPAERLRIGARIAMEAGLPVEYRESEALGHTIVVGEVLEEAVSWLLGHYREARDMGSGPLE